MKNRFGLMNLNLDEDFDFDSLKPSLIWRQQPKIKRSCQKIMQMSTYMWLNIGWLHGHGH